MTNVDPICVAIEPVPVVDPRMQAPAAVPHARPVVRWAEPGWWRETDVLAVASAICGVTAIIPIVTQVTGLVLGIVSLARIRRARRRGVRLRGKLLALAGILMSGFALLSWIAVLGLLVVVGTSFSHTANLLPSGLPPVRP